MKTHHNHIDVKELKARISPDAFYCKEQNLPSLSSKSGKWATAGLCPFHADRHAGTFKINMETGAFKCWSCGAAGGDIIAFIQKRDQLGFIDALRKLSQEWRVQ
ncbi:MAG: hypothetical protein JSS60_07775 [Verrucomicrobia bacterium]|nr:hypothetical protein [Verrucomicrobiota bacterium]